MATRLSVDNCIKKCDEVIKYAEEQYKAGMLQEHYYDVEFSEAMLDMEKAYQELVKLNDSANAQQRERLNRERVRLQQLQNKMILLDHDRPFYSTLHD